jgi:pterin-4a-carbinolamine dehydratase
MKIRSISKSRKGVFKVYEKKVNENDWIFLKKTKELKEKNLFRLNNYEDAMNFATDFCDLYDYL